MADISGFGTGTYLFASNTYPAGIQLTEYSDDTDWIAFEQLTIAETGIAGNGELLSWASLNTINVNLSFFAGGDDDILMSVLGERNRAGRGKTSARDVITLVNVSPTGKITTYKDGRLTVIPPGDSVGNDTKTKTKVYGLQFGNRVGV